MQKNSIINILLEVGFKELEEELEYTNGKIDIYVEGDNFVSIISSINDEQMEYLSIPSLKVDNKKDFLLQLKNIDVL